MDNVCGYCCDKIKTIMKYRHNKITGFINKKMRKGRMNRIRRSFSIKEIWDIILLMFAIVNIIVIGLSVFLFFEINNGELFITEEDRNISVETIDRKLLKDTIELFEMKAIEFENLKYNAPNIIDPMS